MTDIISKRTEWNKLSIYVSYKRSLELVSRAEDCFVKAIFWILNTCVCVCVCVCLLGHSVWLFVTPWTVAHRAPLSMGFLRQEYWSGLPFLSPGHLPNLCLLRLLHWQVESLPLSSLRSPPLNTPINCFGDVYCAGIFFFPDHSSPSRISDA